MLITQKAVGIVIKLTRHMTRVNKITLQPRKIMRLNNAYQQVYKLNAYQHAYTAVPLLLASIL